MTTTSERLGEAVKRARHHWRHHLPGEELQLSPMPRHRPAFTIAISRETGAGASAVAHEIGTQTGWLVHDRELLEKIATETGLRTELLESVDERCTPWLTATFEAFCAAKTINSSTYVVHLAQTLLALSTHGECVIVGRGAAVLLPAATTLRVRLIAPLPNRIARIRQERGLSDREALQYIEKTDRERVEFVETYFHKDAVDYHLYDLVLNSSRFTPKQCAELIVEALQELQSESTERNA